jgi:hypothetical protein
MNRIEAIRCQIRAAAAHVVGPEGYSLASLYEVLNELSTAQDLILATIAKREKVSPGEAKPGMAGMLDFLGAPEDGGAA